MSDLITYDDKIRLKSQNVSEKYKVTAGDMNEIKSVVNTNVELVDEINKPENWVSVGTTAPTDGERVWFEKGKNLFDGQLELGMYDETGAKATSNANYRNVAPINVQPSTTYTFSINGTSQKYVIYLYKKDGTFIRVDILTSGTFTTPAEAYLLNFRCFNADFTSDYANLKIQLEQGSNATSYEPYIEPSINVDEEEWYNPNNIEKYSTKEIKIGTWIDGKPIYRRVLKYTLTLDNNNYGAYTSEADLIKSIDSLIDLRFFVYNGTLIFAIPNGGGINSDRDAGIYIQRSYGGIGFQVSSYSRNNYNNKTAVVVLEYTKTTD